VKHRIMFLACFLGVISAGSVVNAAAQSNAYHQINLVSNLAQTAAHTDRNLLNPWGIASIPGQAFSISANHHGGVRLYDAVGNSVNPVQFAIPPAEGETTRPTPSGIVVNATDEFILNGAASQLLIAAEDGTISGWASVNGNLPSVAAQAVDKSSEGAVFKGIAVLTPACCAPFLAVTNFHSGSVDPFTGFFVRLAPPGSFTDPALPAGYAPFGIQVIGSQVFVTYALQDAAKHDPVLGPGHGIVSIFDLEGNFVKRFASGGPLNTPWGVAKASAHFGAFSNDILIGNLGDGTIEAFNPVTGKFLGRLKDKTGKYIVNPHLWGLTFGGGGTGDPNTRYFTSGPNQGRNGLFGAISVSN
jgi:uncharacterized protein (TIGR03118 family)